MYATLTHLLTMVLQILMINTKRVLTNFNNLYENLFCELYQFGLYVRCVKYHPVLIEIAKGYTGADWFLVITHRYTS